MSLADFSAARTQTFDEPALAARFHSDDPSKYREYATTNRIF